jgi:hypothetical protein
MRKLIIIILFIACLTAGKLIAQAPQSIHWQGMFQGKSGLCLSDKILYMRFSILQGSSNGNIIYQELQNKQTDKFGRINAAIGQGTVTIGSWTNINWSNYNYYIKIEMDETGSGSYVDFGTSQLVSVPYALYAEKSGNVANMSFTVYKAWFNKLWDSSFIAKRIPKVNCADIDVLGPTTTNSLQIRGTN